MRRVDAGAEPGVHSERCTGAWKVTRTVGLKRSQQTHTHAGDSEALEVLMTEKKGRKEGREEGRKGERKKEGREEEGRERGRRLQRRCQVSSSCEEAPSLFSLGFSVGPQAPCLSEGVCAGWAVLLRRAQALPSQPGAPPGLTGHPQAEAASLCFRGTLLDGI